MAYVNVAEWKPEQVTEWLKGLDNVILPYIHAFLNNEVSGQQLLNLQPDDLENLGVLKLGHQELILEAVEYLQNFHYELDRENLQLLALRLSCQAHSLHNELRDQSDTQQVTTQTLADVASVIKAVKPLACWLDRPPFSAPHQWEAYGERKVQLLKLGVEVATCAQRGRFAERPSGEIRTAAAKLASLADDLIRKVPDPLILQPASLELATIRKRAGDDLGFFILPSFHGVHQVGEIKFQSPANQCGKIEEGDEIVQVNYQTVVGWQRTKVVRLLEESPTEVFLTLKKRPRHTSVYGQIYIKPYRLPSKKRAPYFRWHENLPSPRPELLTIPDFEIPLPRPKPIAASPIQAVVAFSCPEGDVEEDDAFLQEGMPAVASTSGSPLVGAVGPLPMGIVMSEGEEEEDGEEEEGAAASPISMRLYLPKPRASVQRRATVTGASPTSTRPPINIEEFWQEIKKERMSRGGAVPTRKTREEGATALLLEDDKFQVREGSGASLVSPPPRPVTCMGSTGEREALAQRRALLGGGRTRHWAQRPLVEGFVGGSEWSPVEGERASEEDLVLATPLGAKPYGGGERARLDKSHSTPAYDMQTEAKVNGETKALKNEDMKMVEMSEPGPKASCLVERGQTEGRVMMEVGSPEGQIPPAPPPRPRLECLPCGAPVARSDASQQQVAGVGASVVSDGCKGYRAMVARTLSRARTVAIPSPHTLRRRNALLAKGRQVSVRDLGEAEHQGWLQYRLRGGGGLGQGSTKGAAEATLGGPTAQWVRAWFLLVGSSFYGFKDQESAKADRLIGLSGFTAALAPEVKSRKFAFKVYHAGKMFYFAAETEEGLNEWIACISDATIQPETSAASAANDDGNEAVYFSETDDESNGAGCLTTPRSNRKNISSGSSNPNLSTSGVLETKSQEVQKKFSSLKKLGSRKGAVPEVGIQEQVGSSLDRKYLRFLKSSSSRNVPVPTAKFRSYRRAGRGPMGMTLPSRDDGERESSPPPSVFGMVWTPDAAPSHRHTRSESSLGPPLRGDAEEVADLRRRRRYVPSPQVAAHAQAVTKPAMAAARRGNGMPPEVIKRPCRHGSTEDPEERVRCMVGARLACQRHVSVGGSSPGATEGGRARGTSASSRPGTFPQPLVPACGPSPQQPQHPGVPRREFRGGSPEKFWIDSLRGWDERGMPARKDRPSPTSPSSLKLKNAALYRPPPLQPKPLRREEEEQTQTHGMKLAFEMSLDHSNEPPTPTTHSRFRLFSPKLSRRSGEGSPSSPPPTPPASTPQKTLLGSPRLHRAIFGVPKEGGGAAGVGCPREAATAPPPLTWPPSPAPPVPTAALEDPLVRSQSKPTMGISMIGKQRRLPPPPPPPMPLLLPSSPPGTPLPSAPATSPTSFAPLPSPTTNPIPDYPGLEYPPVFEPGTYSLSEASFLRANRRLTGGVSNRASPSLPPRPPSPVMGTAGDQGSSLPPRMRNTFQ
ncbi:uncharacterized protein cnk [Hetaerina americana]|uniref:uncharacterized protein cnk n=1 Tax=Hetaerina americana TaxID=62018 RepID=UPI003A7F5C5D